MEIGFVGDEDFLAVEFREAADDEFGVAIVEAAGAGLRPVVRDGSDKEAGGLESGVREIDVGMERGEEDIELAADLTLVTAGAEVVHAEDEVVGIDVFPLAHVREVAGVADDGKRGAVELGAGGELGPGSNRAALAERQAC